MCAHWVPVLRESFFRVADTHWLLLRLILRFPNWTFSPVSSWDGDSKFERTHTFTHWRSLFPLYHGRLHNSLCFPSQISLWKFWNDASDIELHHHSQIISQGRNVLNWIFCGLELCTELVLTDQFGHALRQPFPCQARSNCSNCSNWQNGRRPPLGEEFSSERKWWWVEISKFMKTIKCCSRIRWTMI